MCFYYHTLSITVIAINTSYHSPQNAVVMEIRFNTWLDHSSCRMHCYEADKQFEKSQVEALEHKRAVHKFGTQPSSNLGVWPCDSYSSICSSRIGLYTHQQMHHWQSTPQSVNTWENGGTRWDLIFLFRLENKDWCGSSTWIPHYQTNSRSLSYGKNHDNCYWNTEGLIKANYPLKGATITDKCYEITYTTKQTH